MMKTLLGGKDAAYFEQRTALLTATEIAQQPELWNELADMLQERAGEISSFLGQVLAVPGLRIVFTGAGSSAFIGEMAAALVGREKGLRAECVHTTDIVSSPESCLFDVPTLLVSFARSGDSPESVGTIEYARKKIHNLYNLVITCGKGSHLDRCATTLPDTLSLLMPARSCDQGFAMTSSVSCMLLAAWAAFHYQELDKAVGDIRALSAKMALQLDSIALAAEELAKAGYDRLIFLGSGAMKGLAHEGAIKSLELSHGQVNTNYDSATGFRHGPKTVLCDSAVTVHFLSSDPFSRRYDEDLCRELIAERKGIKVVLVGEKGTSGIESADMKVCYELPQMALPKEAGALVASLLFAQCLGLQKSLALGITTDNPCPQGDVNRVVKGVTVYDL